MTTIKLKNGSGAPTAGDLVQGEPALDLTNKRLYTEDSVGTVIEVGTNPGTDVTFADNRKAIFGAGSDLQIYHDGSHSYVSDQGTGRLVLNSSGGGVRIEKSPTENMAIFTPDGNCELFYDNSLKLATTATGVDVTGTVTADGLTTDGNIAFTDSGSSNRNVLYLDGSDNVVLATGTTAGTRGIDLYTNNSKSLSVAEGGDISFYEDTGTTAKFFWDASAESLGIGTTPSHPLHVVAADGTLALFSNGVDADLNIKTASAVTLLTPSTGTLAFGTSNAEAMRIDSSGNLLVGTTDTTLFNNTTGGGFSVSSNGFTQIAKQGADNADPVLILNQTGLDGEIQRFYKDGSTVGSITTKSGNIALTDGGRGIAVDSTVVHATYSDGSAADAAQDLGSSSIRWKDLYLSGGVYLGGTGTANKLDDYEEGTWTPVLKDSGNGTKTLTTAEGKYIKVGSKVTIWFNVVSSNNLNDVNYNQLQSLPFAPSSDQANYRTLGFAHVAQTTNNRGVPHTVRWFSGTTVFLHCFHDGTTVNAAYADEISGCFEYFV